MTRRRSGGTPPNRTPRKRRCVYERGAKVWHITGPANASMAALACAPGDMIVFPSTFQTRVPTCPDCLAMAARKRAITSAEEDEIVERGGDLAGYRLAREGGATHAECMEIHALGMTMLSYRLALVEFGGMIHAELDEITWLGMHPEEYRAARCLGATHAELVEVARQGPDIWDFVDPWAR